MGGCEGGDAQGDTGALFVVEGDEHGIEDLSERDIDGIAAAQSEVGGQLGSVFREVIVNRHDPPIGPCAERTK